MICRYQPSDFIEVQKLLKESCVEPPSASDELTGAWVAKENGEIIGCIWALIGQTSTAYVDFLAIAERYKKKTLLFARLFGAMERELVERGIKRYYFHVEKYNADFINGIFRKREKLHIRLMRELHYFRRDFR